LKAVEQSVAVCRNQDGDLVSSKVVNRVAQRPELRLGKPIII